MFKLEADAPLLAGGTFATQEARDSDDSQDSDGRFSKDPDRLTIQQNYQPNAKFM